MLLLPAYSRVTAIESWKRIMSMDSFKLQQRHVWFYLVCMTLWYSWRSMILMTGIAIDLAASVMFFPGLEARLGLLMKMDGY